MKISIVGLEHQRGARADFNFTAPLPKLLSPDGQEVKSLEPMQLQGSVTNTGTSFLVEATVKADVELICARCLEHYPYTLEVVFTENYTRSEPEEGFRHFSGDEIPLDEAVLEGLNLSMPLRGFCREDCQGLCPLCGINRNQSSCGCKEETLDPRMAVLGKLLDQPPGGGGKNGST